MWVAEAHERVENISVEKLHSIVKTQGMPPLTQLFAVMLIQCSISQPSDYVPWKKTIGI